MPVDPDSDQFANAHPQRFEWYRDIQLTGIDDRGSTRDEGHALGAALAVGAFVCAIAFFSLRWLGAIGWIVSIAAGFGATVWMYVRDSPRRPLPQAFGYWPVQFAVHDLGAEVSAGEPPARVVVELSHQLQSRSSGRSFWSGMSSGWKAGGNVTNRWYERHRVAFKRNGQRMNFTVAVDWGQVIGIAVDEAAHIIDISAADSPGLRLHCNPETFREVRLFLRGQVHSRFWDTLDPPGAGDASHTQESEHSSERGGKSGRPVPLSDG
jgi:hypothetical protein